MAGIEVTTAHQNEKRHDKKTPRFCLIKKHAMTKTFEEITLYSQAFLFGDANIDHQS